MMKRTFRNGTVHYYYQEPGTKKQIPLGRPLAAALARYKEIAAMQTFGNTPIPDNEFKTLYRRLKNNAHSRGIDVEITEDDVKSIIAKANGRCEVSGIKFDARKINGMRARPWMPSIDRIDSMKGYTLNNCRVVCTAVNYSLNQWGDEVFYAMAIAVAHYRKGLKSSTRQPEESAAEIEFRSTQPVPEQDTK